MTESQFPQDTVPEPSESNEQNEGSTIDALSARIAGHGVVRAVEIVDGKSESEPLINKDLIVQSFEGVFLGDKPKKDGWGVDYIDTNTTPTGEGFTFIVGRNSAGLTYIATESEGEQKVESYLFDYPTGKRNWTPAGEKEVMVSTNYGELGEPTIHERWQDDAGMYMGIEGHQVGLIRVARPDGTIEHFLLGAQFDGREDSWRVKGSYVPIAAQNVDALLTEVEAASQPRAIETAKTVPSLYTKP